MTQANNRAAAAAIYVEVSNEPLIQGKPYTDKNTGMTRPAISKQNCYLHTGARYPVPFKLAVQPETGPLRPGFYLIGGTEAFKPGEYDGLKFWDRGVLLVPVADALAALRSLSSAPGEKAA